MTPSSKPVRRLTSAYVREKGMRPLVATITGSVLELRPHGLRTSETVDLASAWQQAVKARVWAAKLAKRKGKSAKRT